jgi:HSP20 family protein
VIRAAVPGVDPQAVEVTFDGGTITIKGEIKAPEGSRPENFWMRENFWGKFSRQVTMPEDALGDQAKAQFINGLLVLTVPKAQPVKPKSVKIPISGATHGGNNEAAPRQIESTGSVKK